MLPEQQWGWAHHTQVHKTSHTNTPLRKTKQKTWGRLELVEGRGGGLPPATCSLKDFSPSPGFEHDASGPALWRQIYGAALLRRSRIIGGIGNFQMHSLAESFESISFTTPDWFRTQDLWTDSRAAVTGIQRTSNDFIQSLRRWPLYLQLSFFIGEELLSSTPRRITFRRSRRSPQFDMEEFQVNRRAWVELMNLVLQ